MEVWDFLIAKINASFPLMDTAHPHHEWAGTGCGERKRRSNPGSVVELAVPLGSIHSLPKPYFGVLQAACVHQVDALWGADQEHLDLSPSAQINTVFPPGNQINLVPPGSNNTIPIQTDG